MDDFRAFLESHGLVPGAVVADGKIRSCATESHPKRRNGRYFLAPDGRFGWLQDWAIHSEPIQWFADRESSKLLPRIDRAEIRRRQREERERRIQATRGAREFYRACAPLRGGHPYLAGKELDMTGCLGLRVDREGWLVVPALIGRALVSLQRISPAGDKRFWPGASMRGVSYPIERRDAAITVLCEGLATGLAIFTAVRETRVIVAFTSGNLKRVAEKIERLGMAVVAADNDYRTAEKIGRNPGVEAAEEAARILGCGVMIPEGIEGSDWCDLRVERFRERKARRPPNSYMTDYQIRRNLDAEISRAVRRHARMMLPARRAG